ncbi:hypothetical protein ACQ4M4_27335 [Leptolyngbya sp. AN02str]|uniref:hypothetical protein n=1 Tax=Leptolyngbya sp. AN02str TaxID=3423363 RepID=UPI003D314CC4
MSDKATRAQIEIGGFTVDAFMLPDGSYRMSQTQAAECIGQSQRNAGRFLTSKGINALLGQGYTPDSIEADSSSQKRGQTRFNALPLEVVTAYWVFQCFEGNRQALALVMALATETLERRFDAAFDVERTERDRNQRLNKRIQDLEKLIAGVAAGYAMDDAIRQENRFLWEVLREHGIDPYALPKESDRHE